MAEIKLINGNCMEVMAEMKDNEFQLSIADPPYGIGEDGGDKQRCRKVLHATSLKQAERKGREYLKDYHEGESNRRDGDWYFYCDDEVACEFNLVDEITPEQLVERLLI